MLPDAEDETWAKLALPESGWRSVTGVLVGLADGRTRVALWNALRLAVADAELDPALALDIVTRALPAESDDAVLGVVAGWAVRPLVACYFPGVTRGAAMSRLSGALTAVTDVAAAGSGRQLAAAQAAIATASHVGRMQAWLAGRDLPAGLEADTELRWRIVHRLATLGELDEAAIDVEAARDRSSQGAVHAARCRAARPDARAKASAWEAIVGDARRPNYELYALAEGFWDPEQRELTDPYVERYFAEFASTGRLRSGWVADRLALLAYPWTAIDPQTVTATEQLLADESLEPGLRRSVTDAGDDLRRAVAVRARFS
jgi:aminopeptidase N